MTQQNELRELIKWVAKRTRDWRKASVAFKRLEGLVRPGVGNYHRARYMESMSILRKTISVYLPIRHDGMQAFTCEKCGKKAWSKTFILPDVFHNLKIYCKQCSGSGEVATSFYRKDVIYD